MSYESFMTSLAKDAGAIIKKNFTVGMKKKWKSDITPLTATDTAINKIVIKSIKKSFPSHNVLSEEGSDLGEKSDYLWVCDPVDGTIPFSHGIPTCVFSLALTCKGQPVVGTMYDPFQDRLFFAEKGKGTLLNGKSIRVSAQKRLKAAVIGVVWWELAPFAIADAAKLLEKKYAITLNLCSVNYMDALVAAGEFAGTIFPGESAHDSATAKIIVEEAGGRFTDLFGKDQRYDRKVRGHIASNGVLHEELLKIVKDSLRAL